MEESWLEVSPPMPPLGVVPVCMCKSWQERNSSSVLYNRVSLLQQNAVTKCTTNGPYKRNQEQVCRQ